MAKLTVLAVEIRGRRSFRLRPLRKNRPGRSEIARTVSPRIVARFVFSLVAMPANIHLFLLMSALLDRIDAKEQLFSCINPISSLHFAFTCTFAGISSSVARPRKMHVQLQVF
ncbi:hypothetical protein ACFSR7_18500 [Cohnella sp. GCM10020058]|uniref:hypothetical protein n=1 Tax=Cohnella sp. GCM10020058 TaxID=3317330 RepID=UPI003633A11E